MPTQFIPLQPQASAIDNVLSGAQAQAALQQIGQQQQQASLQNAALQQHMDQMLREEPLRAEAMRLQNQGLQQSLDLAEQFGARAQEAGLDLTKAQTAALSDNSALQWDAHELARTVETARMNDMVASGAVQRSVAQKQVQINTQESAAHIAQAQADTQGKSVSNSYMSRIIEDQLSKSSKDQLINSIGADVMVLDKWPRMSPQARAAFKALHPSYGHLPDSVDPTSMDEVVNQTLAKKVKFGIDNDPDFAAEVAKSIFQMKDANAPMEAMLRASGHDVPVNPVNKMFTTQFNLSLKEKAGTGASTASTATSGGGTVFGEAPSQEEAKTRSGEITQEQSVSRLDAINTGYKEPTDQVSLRSVWATDAQQDLVSNADLLKGSEFKQAVRTYDQEMGFVKVSGDRIKVVKTNGRWSQDDAMARELIAQAAASRNPDDVIKAFDDKYGVTFFSAKRRAAVLRSTLWVKQQIDKHLGAK